MSDEPIFCFTFKSSQSAVFHVLAKLSTQVQVYASKAKCFFNARKYTSSTELKKLGL